MPRLTIEHLWLSLPVAFVCWRGFLQPVRMYDFWWHLKAGEVIITTWSIPRTDLFSYTAAGAPSVPHCWLAEVLFYLEYCAGGLPLMIAMNTALLVAALWPIYHLCLQGSGNVRWGVVAASLAAAELGLFSGMRPQVFSFVLLAVLYWILDGYRRERRDWLWAIPPLMALWVNLHGAFILGLGVISLVVICEAARRLVHGHRDDVLSIRELGKLSTIWSISVLATLANPETYKIYAFLREFGMHKYEFVGEWQVPRINNLEGIVIFHGPFFITLVVLLLARDRPDLTELALFLGFAGLGLTSYRNGVWFSLIVAPIVGRCLPALGCPEILRSLRRFTFLDKLVSRMGRENANPMGTPRYGLNLVIASMMVAITVILSPWVYPYLGIGPEHTGLLEKETPVGAMDYIERHHLEGNIFHPQAYGDYLIWRLWPRQCSFFNSQVHLFGPSLLEDQGLVFHDPHWEERLAPYDIKFLMLRKHAEDNQKITDDARRSPNWRVLYEDGLSILFERTE